MGLLQASAWVHTAFQAAFSLDGLVRLAYSVFLFSNLIFWIVVFVVALTVSQKTHLVNLFQFSG